MSDGRHWREPQPEDYVPRYREPSTRRDVATLFTTKEKLPERSDWFALMVRPAVVFLSIAFVFAGSGYAVRAVRFAPLQREMAERVAQAQETTQKAVKERDDALAALRKAEADFVTLQQKAEVDGKTKQATIDGLSRKVAELQKKIDDAW